VDAFLGGFLSAGNPRTLLVLASDHGNIEDLSTGHTTNPTLAILAGSGASELRKKLTYLTDVAPMILSYLTEGV
jgi:bisphosphoglycerate-independent phosphoglycerate mutase (AlkP superfamily)